MDQICSLVPMPWCLPSLSNLFWHIDGVEVSCQPWLLTSPLSFFHCVCCLGRLDTVLRVAVNITGFQIPSWIERGLGTGHNYYSKITSLDCVGLPFRATSAEVELK